MGGGHISGMLRGVSLAARGLVTFSAASAPLNTYYMLRHGQSLANVAGVISSSPALATVEHGLSDEGRAQARRAAEQFAELARDRPTAIISSDFMRARETAQHAADQLAAGTRAQPLYRGQVVLDQRLRERSFGEFDGRGVECYARVWEEDAHDGTHTLFGVESVASVAKRTTELLASLEETLPAAQRPWLVLLVAHGDVLQILQATALALEPRMHRTVAHLGTAELRKLERPSDIQDAYRWARRRLGPPAALESRRSADWRAHPSPLHRAPPLPPFSASAASIWSTTTGSWTAGGNPDELGAIGFGQCAIDWQWRLESRHVVPHMHPEDVCIGAQRSSLIQ